MARGLNPLLPREIRSRQGLISEESSVADPDTGSGAFFVPWIWDPGWVKNQDPDPGSGSGMNIPDHISESLEIFWDKNT